MPLMNNTEDMEQFQVPNSFAFSGQRINTLGASEFTIAALCVDKSGSVGAFRKELENCMGESVKAMRKSPRADNMMVRTTAFNGSLEEIHGFKTLTNINPGDFDNAIHPGGSTALFDATVEAMTAMLTYAKELNKQDFSVNGILLVVTDGDDNVSTQVVSSVKNILEEAVKGEVLESLVSILVGVNVSNLAVKTSLDNFHQSAGFTQFVVIEKADGKSLAQLAQFISKSVSAQSQALGSGGPSRSLTF